MVNGKQQAVNPEHTGTKAAARHRVTIDAGQTATIRLRLSDLAPAAIGDPFKSFVQIMQLRRDERTSSFIDTRLLPVRPKMPRPGSCAKRWRECWWSKQYFFFDVDLWLTEHGVDPMKPGGRFMRNSEWFHMVNQHIISMPDKWEYPWYAAWDLAFHTIALLDGRYRFG